MPRKTKLFISHSAHRAQDKRILERLVELLEAAGFLVYCDRKRLKPGDCWRNELYSAIGCCHAAVVLVTKEALDVKKHPWVFKECSMLTILKWTDKGFPIFPVAMTGVTANDIKNSPFEALLISEIQLGSQRNLDRVVDTIKDRLCAIKYSDEDEPLYHHHNRIEDHLKLITDPQSLKESIESIDSELDRWDPLDEQIRYRYRLARLLLTLDADRVVATLRGILPSLGEQRSTKLIYLLAPFWLDLPAIAQLDDVVQNEQKMIQTELKASGQIHERLRTAFGLNAKDPMTARLHASRAGYLKKKPYTVIMPPADAGTDDEGRYASHIIAEINQRSGRINQSGQSLDTLMINLAIQFPIFVVIPHGTDKEVVKSLRKRFWPFIFIVLTGQDKPAEWNLDEFVMLQPPLEVGLEDKVCLMAASAIFEATSIIRD
jgi:hypothetical protein